MTFEFSKTVSCHADMFSSFLKVLSVQLKEHYRLMEEEDVMLPSSKEVSVLLSRFHSLYERDLSFKTSQTQQCKQLNLSGLLYSLMFSDILQWESKFSQ